MLARCYATPNLPQRMSLGERKSLGLRSALVRFTVYEGSKHRFHSDTVLHHLLRQTLRLDSKLAGRLGLGLRGQQYGLHGLAVLHEEPVVQGLCVVDELSSSDAKQVHGTHQSEYVVNLLLQLVPEAGDGRQIRRNLVESCRDTPKTGVGSNAAGHKLIVDLRVVEIDVLDNVAQGLQFRAIAVKMCRHAVERLVRASIDAGQVLVVQILANEIFFLPLSVGPAQLLALRMQ